MTVEDRIKRLEEAIFGSDIRSSYKASMLQMPQAHYSERIECIGLVLTDNSPVNGISWSPFQIVYKGVVYDIPSGGTTLKYIIWNEGDSTVTATDVWWWAENRFLIAVNWDTGNGLAAWNRALAII